MKSIDLTAIIQAFILLISSVITIYILPKVKAVLTEKLSAEQRENLKKWVRVAVAAAEQLYNGSGLGEDKYRYVVSFLEEKGIYVNYKEVEALIESEVYKLAQDYKIVFPDVGSTSSEGTDNKITDPSVPDEETESDEAFEPDTADEECESDTAEAEDLFSVRNTCE